MKIYFINLLTRALGLIILGATMMPGNALAAMGESFFLNNGLKVILLEQPDNPLVSMRVLVKAGATAEKMREEYGLAHLMEHMAFKGTKNYPEPGIISTLVERNGGSLNAYTSADETVYYINMPREEAVLGLNILADLVFAPIYDSNEYKLEKEVVIEEIKRSADNPDRLLGEKFFALAYPEHPYGRPVIGLEETVRGASLQDAKNFHQKHYRPDNAILVVSGGFDLNEVKLAIEKSYNAITKPKAALIIATAPPAPQFKKPQIQLLSSDKAEVAKVIIGFTGPNGADNRDYPLDLLSSVLSSGQASRLVEVVQNQKKLVSSISAYSYTPRYNGQFFISFESEPNQVVDAISAIWEELNGLVKNPPSLEELARARALAEKDFILAQESSQGLGSTALSFENHLGDYRLKDSYLPILKRLNGHDVLSVAEEIFRPEKMAVTVLLPQKTGEAQLINEAQLEKVVANFKLPPLADKKTASNKFEEIKLENGLKILMLRDASLPLVTIKVGVLGGQMVETEKDQGLVNFLAEVWPRATKSRPSENLSRDIEGLGAQISGFSGRNSMGLSASFLASNWEDGLKILMEIIKEPAFAASDLEIVRPEIVAQVKAQNEQLSSRVFRLLSKEIYGEHPYHLEPLGTLETVTAFNKEDLSAMYGRLIGPENMVIAVAGDIEPHRVKEILTGYLADWSGSQAKVAIAPAPPAITTFKKVEEIIDRAQTHLAYGFLVPGLGSSEQASLDVLSAYLSGMAGPLFRELRDQKSLAYTVMSSYNPGLEVGAFSFYIATDPKKVDEALAGFNGIIEKIKTQKISEEELAGTKRFLSGSIKQRNQTIANRATQALLNDLYHLGIDFDEKHLAAIEKVTAEDVLKMAQKYLSMENGALAMLGKEKIK